MGKTSESAKWVTEESLKNKYILIPKAYAWGVGIVLAALGIGNAATAWAVARAAIHDIATQTVIDKINADGKRADLETKRIGELLDKEGNLTITSITANKITVTPRNGNEGIFVETPGLGNVYITPTDDGPSVWIDHVGKGSQVLDYRGVTVQPIEKHKWTGKPGGSN